MQRVIKFRGRVRKTGEWVYGSLELYSYGAGPGTAIIHTFLDWGLNGSVQVDPKTVGQFTGLKDKNGNEIYEGDVVEYKNPAFTSDIRKDRVEWDEWYAGFDPFCNHGVDISYKIDGLDVGVIGNIHENPDLLSNPQ